MATVRLPRPPTMEARALELIYDIVDTRRGRSAVVIERHLPDVPPAEAEQTLTALRMLTDRIMHAMCDFRMDPERRWLLAQAHVTAAMQVALVAVTGDWVAS